MAPPQRLIQTYAELVETDAIADLVSDDTGIPAARLLQSVQAVAPLESLFIDIIARDQDPDTAARIANSFANTLIDRSPDYTVDTSKVKLLSLAQPASPPDDPIAPRPLFDSLLGGMAGLMGGIVGVYVAAYFAAPGALPGRPRRDPGTAHAGNAPRLAPGPPHGPHPGVTRPAARASGDRIPDGRIARDPPAGSQPGRG